MVLPNGGFRLNLDNPEVLRKINDNLVAALSVDVETRRDKSNKSGSLLRSVQKYSHTSPDHEAENEQQGNDTSC